jgi:hypothetical protein
MERPTPAAVLLFGFQFACPAEGLLGGYSDIGIQAGVEFFDP